MIAIYHHPPRYLRLSPSGHRWQLVLTKAKATPRCQVRYCRNRAKPNSRTCHTCIRRLWRANHVEASVYRGIKDRATRKKISFTISLAFFIQWATENSYIDGRGVQKLCLHVDRIIPALGYVEGNLQVLTCSENVIKGNKERHNGYPF